MIHINTPDGELYILNGGYDFLRLVEKYMGAEAGQKTKEMINAADYTSQAIDTDLRVYELHLDDFRSACTEILKLMELIEAEVTAKRVNRARVKGILQEIKTELEMVL